jgi:hypothetical protein
LGLDKQGSEADSAPVAVSRITAPENGKPEPTNWYPWTREQNQDVLSRPTISATVVEMNLRLNMDFQTAGQEGSMNRQMFIKDLKQDLADASGMGTSDFNILKVSPGSVVVDIDAPEKAAQEIHRQSLDPNSRLRSGKVTRFTDKITMPRGMQGVISSAVVAPSVDCKGQPQKKESTGDDEKEEIAEEADLRKEPQDSFALASRRMNEEGLLSPLMRLTSVSGHCFCLCFAHSPYLFVSPFCLLLALSSSVCISSSGLYACDTPVVYLGLVMSGKPEPEPHSINRNCLGKILN